MTGRSLTAGIKTELLTASTSPRYFLKAEFDSGDLRLWTGIGDATLGGETYTGGGRMLSVETIDETMETVANGVRISLAVIPTTEQPDAVDAILDIAHGEEYQGRAVTIWQAQMDDSGAIISDPFIRFKGRLDVMSETELPGAAVISVTAENRLIDLERDRRRTYTPEDHKAEHAGDTFFDGVAALQTREIKFG